MSELWFYIAVSEWCIVGYYVNIKMIKYSGEINWFDILVAVVLSWMFPAVCIVWYCLDCFVGKRIFFLTKLAKLHNKGDE